MNSLKVAVALRALADAFEEDAQDAAPATDTAAAGPKRGRGRPVKGEETTAVAGSAPVQASSTTSPTPAVVEADPFANTAPTLPATTLEEVRTALTDLRGASSQDIAIAVLKTAGDASNLTDLKAEKYRTVVVAAKAKQAEYTKAPVVETDPFATPAGALAAASSLATDLTPAKPVTIEEVKAMVVETQKRTSQDTVQSIVMKHGGKSNVAGQPPGPSLKALPEANFAAVIAELKALPTTK